MELDLKLPKKQQQLSYSIPSHLVIEYDLPSIKQKQNGICSYCRNNNTIFMSNQIHPHTRQFVFDHEYAHYLHYVTNIVNTNSVDPLFLNVCNISKLNLPDVGNNFIEDAEKFKADISDPLINEQFGCFYDLIGSLSLGEKGAGHTKNYYTSLNNNFMETYVHTYAAINSEILISPNILKN